MTSLGSHITVISGFSGDQRMLFKTDNKLLQKQKVKQYPSCFPDSTSLADAFNNFFISKIDKIHNAFTERAPENDLSSSHTTDRPLYYWQTSVRCADSQLWTSYFGYGIEICCEDINIILWPWYTSSICSKNMLSHHPTYTNLGYNHVPQEWCHAICFESCCIKTASQETRCWFWAITKFLVWRSCPGSKLELRIRFI